uniref:ribonuclease H n=1 Tax=Nothobranchius furzeri TaxID=105023 RepID=A0A8C6PQJ6_NOTFU
MTANTRPLSERAREWGRLCAMSKWISETIHYGHALHFQAAPPPFNGIVETTFTSQVQSQTLELELRDLLSKDAISRVPRRQELSGFYSPYFVVPKKSGGMRPILDLSLFNCSIAVMHFRMLTMRQVLEYVRSGDWFTSTDLKDAYFHIPVIPRHRKFLHFSFRGVQYQFNRLPFGYSLAPRTFSKCLETALQPLRAAGMRVLFYLDELLLCARSEDEASERTRKLTEHLSTLGFSINWEKSSILPSQSIVFLGVELNASLMRARLSPVRGADLIAVISRVQPRRIVRALLIMKLLGMMAAAHAVVPLGLLHTRRLQRWFIRLRVHPIRQKARMLRVPPSVGGDLAHWGNPCTLSHGIPIGRPASHVSVVTDASLLGWGGTCLSHTVVDHWPSHTHEHINVLELMTVRNVVRHFAALLEGRHVEIHTNNRVAAAYINRQGGVRSLPLLRVATDLLCWAHVHLLPIKATYIPVVLNVAADILSRGGPRDSDWRLHPALVSLIWMRFGVPSVDLFAAQENAQCRLWFSLSPRDRPPLGADAFSHQPWPRMLLYAFPPVPLIPRLLDRVRSEQLSVILVAPRCLSASWFPDLQALVCPAPRGGCHGGRMPFSRRME